MSKTMAQESRDKLLREAMEHPNHFMETTNELFRILIGHHRYHQFVGNRSTMKDLEKCNAITLHEALKMSDNIVRAIGMCLKSWDIIFEDDDEETYKIENRHMNEEIEKYELSRQAQAEEYEMEQEHIEEEKTLQKNPNSYRVMGEY